MVFFETILGFVGRDNSSNWVMLCNLEHYVMNQKTYIKISIAKRVDYFESYAYTSLNLSQIFGPIQDFMLGIYNWIQQNIIINFYTNHINFLYEYESDSILLAKCIH